MITTRDIKVFIFSILFSTLCYALFNQPLKSAEARDGGGEVASFGLAAGPSAKDIFPEPLDEALWKMEELSNEFGDTQGVRFTYGSAAGAIISKEFRPRAGTRGSG